MAVALLRPGQTHGDVPKMKHALVRELVELGHRELASQIELHADDRRGSSSPT